MFVNCLIFLVIAPLVVALACPGNPPSPSPCKWHFTCVAVDPLPPQASALAWNQYKTGSILTCPDPPSPAQVMWLTPTRLASAQNWRERASLRAALPPPNRAQDSPPSQTQHNKSNKIQNVWNWWVLSSCHVVEVNSADKWEQPSGKAQNTSYTTCDFHCGSIIWFDLFSVTQRAVKVVTVRWSDVVVFQIATVAI